MRFGSLCSGIEAASCAWNTLGWSASFFAEIESFPSQVLAHHYPEVPNRGDITKFKEWPVEPIDLLVGGTPCQSFSVAGLRKGMADPRGNLALVFLAIADRLRPRWVVWENVPGVLSSHEGRDFGCFLGGLGELGYGFAYRVLDAQYFGLAQRRKRVFVVGCLGDWRGAAAVLFERESLSGNPPPSRKTREGIAASLRTRAPGSGGQGSDFTQVVANAIPAHSGILAPDFGNYVSDIAPTLDAQYGAKMGQNNQHIDGGAGLFVCSEVSRTLRAQAQLAHREDQDTLIAFDSTQVTSRANRSNPQPDAPCHTLVSGASAPCIAPSLTASNNPSRSPQSSEVTQQVAAVYRSSMSIRRLTPRECERLQGFPDDYTLVPVGKKRKPAADGPRYEAIGNSMAVPVMRWLGRRILAADAAMKALDDLAGRRIP